MSSVKQLEDCLKLLKESEATAEETMTHLKTQREIIQKSKDNVNTTKDALKEADKTAKRMIRREDCIIL